VRGGCSEAASSTAADSTLGIFLIETSVLPFWTLFDFGFYGTL